MYIKNIKLKNFRNYTNLNLDLKENFNILYGNNAQGKTNIIESIYLSAIGKSFRTKRDRELIKLNSDKAIVEMKYQKEDREGQIKTEIDEKKIFYINGIKQKKISDIIGNIKIVLFHPDDINIIKGGPNLRRRFLDIMISQLKPKYLHILNAYLKTLEQRNYYLKQIKFEGKPLNMLEIWDEKLSELSYEIYKYRKKYIEEIQEKIKVIHRNITICGEKEDINIKYITSGSTKEEIYNSLKKQRNIDIKKGYTSVGIHRDDIEIYINNKMVNIYGSQGQQRTTILSLKLTELNIIFEETGEKPILLLDDFMSELDENRIKTFIDIIKDNQVIITCTEKIKLDNMKDCFYKINNGEIERG